MWKRAGLSSSESEAGPEPKPRKRRVLRRSASNASSPCCTKSSEGSLRGSEVTTIARSSAQAADARDGTVKTVHPLPRGDFASEDDIDTIKSNSGGMEAVSSAAQVPCKDSDGIEDVHIAALPKVVIFNHQRRRVSAGGQKTSSKIEDKDEKGIEDVVGDHVSEKYESGVPPKALQNDQVQAADCDEASIDLASPPKSVEMTKTATPPMGSSDMQAIR